MLKLVCQGLLSSELLAAVAALQSRRQPVRAARHGASRAPRQAVECGISGYLDRHGHRTQQPLAVVAPWQVTATEFGAFDENFVKHGSDLGVRFRVRDSLGQCKLLLLLDGLHYKLSSPFRRRGSDVLDLARQGLLDGHP